jgi:glycerol-3-phosphate dehydrogenase (NAD(P)+)
MIETVGVLGGGAWGTALALVAARAGRQTSLWARDPATLAAIRERNENPRYLPGVTLDGMLAATADMPTALAADIVILALPAQTIRSVLQACRQYVQPATAIVIAAKGLERGTDKRLSEIVTETIPHAIPALLSGPSFAADVARGLPTAVTIATADPSLALALCHALAGPTFRPYAGTDIVGVEIGGAVKNVMAIAAGIVAGRGLGASAQAALVARAFAELRRLGEAMGARPDTLMGLSGLGDLVLTCANPQSRNFAHGERLGRGEPAAGALAEGVATAAAARALAHRHGVAMPIVEAVAAIIEGSITIDAAIDGLMARPLKRETD